MDWQQIETEYITTDISYRKLAEKHGVDQATIARNGKAGGWVEKRKQYISELQAKTIDAIGSRRVDRAAKILTVADKLLNKIDEMVESMEPVDIHPKSIRMLTAAVKDLKEIQGVKSHLDEQEQEARIANLRKQAEKDDTNNTGVIEVVFAAGPEEWNE